MGIDWDEFDKLDEKAQMKIFQDLVMSKDQQSRNEFVLANLDEIGKRFMFAKKFMLLDILPEGFYKKSYWGVDTFTGESVVILITKPDVIKHRKIKTDLPEEIMFRRECLVAYNLKHPNLAEFYEAGTTHDGQSYIAYKFDFNLENNLEKFLTEYELTAKQAIKVLYNISRGLAYLHNNRLIHGDVKASNIIVSPRDLSARLIDFGNIQLAGRENLKLTGSISYTAPEVLDGKEITAAADVFGLGVVGYQMLYRKLPFSVSPEEWPDGLIEKIKTEEPRIDKKFYFLKKMLEKDPKKRLQNGKECMDELYWIRYLPLIFFEPFF